MSALPPVGTVVDAMERRWRDFGNVSSPKLRAVWAVIVQTFSAQITHPSEHWPVIPAELGVGKSTLAKIFCSLLRREDHPGVLIVVRTKDQANEYATTSTAGPTLRTRRWRTPIIPAFP